MQRRQSYIDDGAINERHTRAQDRGRKNPRARSFPTWRTKSSGSDYRFIARLLHLAPTDLPKYIIADFYLSLGRLLKRGRAGALSGGFTVNGRLDDNSKNIGALDHLA